MNIEAYNKIIDIIEPVLTAKGMKAVDNEDGAYFANDAQAVKVSFDEAKKLFKLNCGAVEDGKATGEWKVISEWLFPEDYTVNDAVSIGNDFSDSLGEFLGTKKTVSRTSDVSISGDAKSSMSLEGLLSRFLTIFPQYKEAYQEHVGKYGECLYVDFFEKTAVVCMRELLEQNDKKRLKKFFELLNQYYTLGDKNAAAVVSAVIMKESITDEKLEQTAYKYMEDYKYLKLAYENMKSVSEKVK